MKTGISVNFAFTPEAARANFTHLRLLGYDCADLQTFADTETDWFSTPAPDRLKRWEEIGKIARDCGISISQTHGPWRYPPRDATEEDRAERFEKMSITLEGTAAVGSPWMVIHNIMPFGGYENPDPERFMELNRDFFTRLLEKAKSCGVGIALENMPFKNLILSTPEQVLNFVREFDLPYFRVCLDTGHAAIFGLSAGDSVRLLGKEYLVCTHVHDNDGAGDRHWLPYRGVTDWADFSRALHEIGYDGTLSLETNVSRKLPPSVRPECERALAAVARAMTMAPESDTQ